MVGAPGAEQAPAGEGRAPYRALAGRSQHRALAVAVAVATVGVLPGFLTGAVGVQLREALGLSVTQLGVAVSAFFGTSALASVWLGQRAEALGSLPAMRIGVVISAAAMACVAFVVDSFAGLVACLAAGGLANALAQPAASLLLARATRPQGQGLAFGIEQSAVPAAVLASGIAVPAIAVTAGWRPAYAIAAVAALAAIAAGRGMQAPRPAARGGERAAIGSRPLALLVAAAVLGALPGTALGSFLVSSAQGVGISAGAAGALLAGASLLCLCARVGAGWLADRARSDGLRPIAGLLALGAVGFLLLATGATGAFAIGALVAFVGAWGWPGLLSFAVARRSSGAVAATTAIIRYGVLAGAGLGPLCFGALAGALSFEAAWLLMAAIAVCAALAAAAVRGMGGPAPVRRPP